MPPQYLSEFEILSQSIVPPQANVPPAIPLPFVNQGYFLLVTRLPDGIPGDLNVRLAFFPSIPFANTAFLLVDLQDEMGNTELPIPFPTAPAADGSYTASFPVGANRTVLFGIQPNTVDLAANGPLGTGVFGSRGYVTIDADAGSAQGSYQLAAVPEIRASFFTVTLDAQGVPTPDFTGASEVAYALPTASAALLTLTKAKETKEKEKDKEAHKDAKDHKDVIDTKGDLIEKPRLRDTGPQSEPGLASLAQRLAAIEELIGSGSAFITSAQRPPIG
jgi:hypothetical protein